MSLVKNDLHNKLPEDRSKHSLLIHRCNFSPPERGQLMPHRGCLCIFADLFSLTNGKPIDQVAPNSRLVIGQQSHIQPNGTNQNPLIGMLDNNN